MKEKPLIAELGDDSESAAKRYLKIFVGQESVFYFALYEIIITFIGSIPGALGYFLRGKAFKSLLGSVGRGTVFGRNLTLRCPRQIHIGERVMVDDYAVLDAKGATSAIKLGNQILIGRNSILTCSDSEIEMGDFIHIGSFCTINSRSLIKIGSHVQIGTGAQLMAGSHSFDDPDKPTILQTRVSKGIVIEDSVWIGNASIILDGITVGHNSIIGSGSVVSKDVPPYSVVLGNPARVIQKRK